MRSGFFFAQEHFRSAIILKWFEECIKVGIAIKVKQQTFQFVAVVHCIEHGLIDIRYSEISYKVAEMASKERAQPFRIIPLVKQAVQYIVVLAVISYCP